MSIYNLFSYLQSETAKRGNYELLTPLPRFLRVKSDRYSDGWLIDDFILLFQRKDDDPIENEWKDGPVYIFEINLKKKRDCDHPTALVARFDYNSMSDWLKISPSDHWGFYKPIHLSEQEPDRIDDGQNFSWTVSGDGTKYWGLKSVRGHHFPLTDITEENAFDKIIGGFEKL
jgi:hypothetical protein